MSSARACPRCGLSRPVPFVEGVCIECYLQTRRLEIPKVELSVCIACGRYLAKSRWVSASKSSALSGVASIVERKLGKLFEPYGLAVFVEVSEEGEATAVISDQLGRSYAWPLGRVVELRYTVCPDCSKKALGQYAAVIQVRGGSGPLSTLAKKRVRELLEGLPESLRASLVEVKEEEGGVNVYVYDQASARAIADKILKNLPGVSSESFKLVSRKGDKVKSRLSISVRVFESVKKALVEYRGRVALAEWRSDGKVELKVVPSGERFVLDARKDASKLRPIEGGLEEVEVLKVEGSKATVLLKGRLEEVEAVVAWGNVRAGSKALLVLVGERRFLVGAE